jgi:hypothetical protein
MHTVKVKRTESLIVIHKQGQVKHTAVTGWPECTGLVASVGITLVLMFPLCVEIDQSGNREKLERKIMYEVIYCEPFGLLLVLRKRCIL